MHATSGVQPLSPKQTFTASKPNHTAIKLATTSHMPILSPNT